MIRKVITLILLIAHHIGATQIDVNAITGILIDKTSNPAWGTYIVVNTNGAGNFIYSSAIEGSNFDEKMMNRYISALYFAKSQGVGKIEISGPGDCTIGSVIYHRISAINFTF